MLQLYFSSIRVKKNLIVLAGNSAGSNDFYLPFTGENRAVFFGHFLCGVHFKNISSWFRPTPWIVLEKHLEHDGFCRRRHRVNYALALASYCICLISSGLFIIFHDDDLLQ